MFPHFDRLVDSEFDHNCQLLENADFPDSVAAVRSLTRLRDTYLTSKHSAAESPGQSGEPTWFKTLKRIFLEAPFPEAVLDAVDVYVRRCKQPTDAFDLFHETPRSLEVLARLSCGSPFLTQTLMDQPDALRELTIERRTAAMKSREDFSAEALDALSSADSNSDKLSILRRVQRREILRIGMCDAFGLLDLKFVTLQISLLADAMVQICLQIACEEHAVATSPFSVLALGKHGGEELNYSSDIDLIFVGDSNDTSIRVARSLIVGLSQKMNTGFLYRVDMRLRPWGDAGTLVCSPESYRSYLQNNAEPWEKQALLKARVVAGDLQPGQQFLDGLAEVLFDITEEQVVNGVRGMKSKIESRLKKSGLLETEIKLGSGSIRDIEFLVQALQLIHGKSTPQLASPNTLDALVRLAEFGVLNAVVYRQLREGYIFLRTVEHALQLLHNQQTHELPTGEIQREWLARRMDYPDAATLLSRFNAHRRAVRRAFDGRFSEQNTPDEIETPGKAGKPQSATTSRLVECVRELQSADTSPDQLIRDLESGSICRVQISVTSDRSDHCVIQIAASRGAGIMSMISGLFIANDLDIREGDALHGAGTNCMNVSVKSGQFLGIFICKEMKSGIASDVVARARVIEDSLRDLVTLQHEGHDSQVRSTLLELFCRQVQTLPLRGRPMDDFSVVISNTAENQTTRMEISADDTFGFLFEVTNALTICGFRIRRAEVGESNGRINDILYVTESDGQPVLRAERLQELQTAVTLIKQFTNWLPSTNEPHQALLRFRDLLHLLLPEAHWETSAETLGRPEVLHAVAQVLGISRYLWEDFLRVKTGKLLPLLTDPDVLKTRIQRTDLELELQSLLELSTTEDERRQLLNEFKDHHLFRIDLRHVLGFCGPFGAFSGEITELAEVVVDAAGRSAYEDLIAVHGTPRSVSGKVSAYTIAALGKFGGVEMGFASDIELFLVFGEDGRTDGRSSLANGAFFERLVQKMNDSIQSRHKGIFEIDLRMRPYGQAGSPAVSLDTFVSYFGPTGEAWPYERQSLVKLRCVCGLPEFGTRLLAHCHDIIYGGLQFDFDAMRGMREQQVRQLVHGGTVNAKLSDGGLVDCEYAVQALQMTFGHKHAALRSSNTLVAMEAAHELKLISDAEFQSARAAYAFLRQLIDCLRMARGNAQDLTVPPDNSPDYQLLARRMQAVHESSLRLETLEEQLAATRRFATRVEEICRQN